MLLSCSLTNYIVIKIQRGWESLLAFQLKITSWACLQGSGLKFIFHCCTQWLVSAAELSLLCSTENKEVSSVMNLVFDDNSSAKSFMYIKKSGPSIETCGTPALTLVHVETCPFKTSLCFLFLKKLHKFKPRQICYFVLIWK